MLAGGARNLVLASRSERVDGAVANMINELQKVDVKVTITVEACDVANSRSIEALITHCSQPLPPIRRCIHAAMVLRDVPFENMTHADYAEVTRYKVPGAWTCTRRSPGLRQPSTSSSSSPRRQASSAANRALDALARHRRRLGMPGTSLALAAASTDDASASGCSPTLGTALTESALVRASSDKEGVHIVVAGLAAKLAIILMIPPESLDPSSPVTAYGLDSLNVIEWKKWITRTFKETLQVLELLTAGSLFSLAASIWRRRKPTINPAMKVIVKAAVKAAA
jgi:hypothetical protein